MLPFLGALAGGILSVAGGAAAAVSSMATTVLSGAGSLLFGAGQATVPVVAGTEAAFMTKTGAGAIISKTAGAGILAGLPSAASQTVDYLGNLAPTAAGIYQVISPPEKVETLPATKSIPFMQAPTIAKSSLPIFSQQPATMTIGSVEKPEAPNYMLYIILAILALFLLRKK